MKQRVWQIAIVTAAGAIGTSSAADAALFYWQDYNSGYYRPEPQSQPRRQKVRRPVAKKVAVRKDTAARPQGPLIVAVSIQNQKVRIYDAKGHPVTRAESLSELSADAAEKSGYRHFMLKEIFTQARAASGTDHEMIQRRAHYDLVIANILAGPLIHLAPHFAKSLIPGGHLLLAGLLETQEAQVRRACRRAVAPPLPCQRLARHPRGGAAA